jgi:DNA-binding transcriptional ArsR family regulator
VASGLVRIGALLADPTRAQILVALMDGRARTGSELARHVGVAASTTSEHLGKLLDAALVCVEAQGRHRYWRLASASVAELLETLGASTSAVMPLPPAPRAPANLARARSCYDHLAGEIAVAIFDRLVADEHLAEVDHGLVVTPQGVERFASFGVDVAAMTSARRPLARACLDWTERKHHLGGAAGRALFDAFQTSGWLRRGRQPRTIHLTDTGRKALHENFGWSPGAVLQARGSEGR